MDCWTWRPGFFSQAYLELCIEENSVQNSPSLLKKALSSDQALMVNFMTRVSQSLSQGEHFSIDLLYLIGNHEECDFYQWKTNINKATSRITLFFLKNGILSLYSFFCWLETEDSEILGTDRATRRQKSRSWITSWRKAVHQPGTRLHKKEWTSVGGFTCHSICHYPSTLRISRHLTYTVQLEIFIFPSKRRDFPALFMKPLSSSHNIFQESAISHTSETMPWSSL